jgi:hypothetical protein
MVIVTGGLHRSGTTWLYNVLRSMYPTYKNYFAENFPIDLNTSSIIKSHKWHESFVDTTSIRIVRDLRSVAASLLEFEPLKNYYSLNCNNIVDHLNKIIQLESEDWKENLLIKYEDTKLVNIEKIKNFLEIDVNVTAVYNSVEKIKHPTVDRDLTTEFWPKHITNSNYQNLPVNIIKYIERDFDWWFTKYEYC